MGGRGSGFRPRSQAHVEGLDPIERLSNTRQRLQQYHESKTKQCVVQRVVLILPQILRWYLRYIRQALAAIIFESGGKQPRRIAIPGWGEDDGGNETTIQTQVFLMSGS